MRNLVVIAIIVSGIVAGIAVIGMILLGWREGDGLATTITGNLQGIAVALVVAISGVVQHFLGMSTAASNPTPAPPAPAPPAASAPAGGA